jgi:hypothetical protein
MLSSVVRKTSQLLNIKKKSDDLSEQDLVKYESIKAFRTIITMVHYIPSLRVLPVKVVDFKPTF